MTAAARAGQAPPAGLILAVETSCDDTSAAVVRGREVLSSIVSSQNELHAQFGGVVPEVASRRHTELVNEVVAEAMSEAGAGWDDLAAVAVTQGPGLIGALLVGLATAKSLAYRRGLPLIPVNHLQGHIAANYALGVEAPFVCLVASGGHTLLAVVEEGVRYRVAAKTMDDAAGEAFDKGARLLGLGYPGGKELDELAARGDPGFARFPRAVPRGRGFSFSGLKTALLYDLRGRDEAEVEAHRADIAASYQAAIVRQLVEKTLAGAAAEGLRTRRRRRRRGRQLRPAPRADRGLRGRGPAAVAAAAQPVHRQRRHDRPGGRLPAGAAVAGLPRPRRVRQRRRGQGGAAAAEGLRPPRPTSPEPAPPARHPVCPNSSDSAGRPPRGPVPEC